MTKLRTYKDNKKLMILKCWSKIDASPLPAYCSQTRKATNVIILSWERSFLLVIDWYKTFKNPRKIDQIINLQSNYKIEDTRMLIKDSNITFASSLLLNDSSYECGNGLILKIFPWSTRPI